jgi:hypothetical protein
VRRLGLIAAALAALGATGCVGSQSPEDRAAACNRFADDVKSAGLSGTPTLEQVNEAANGLDARLGELRDPSAHDAAVALHASLHALARALDRDDSEHSAEVLGQAREQATDAAEACDLDPSRFGV